MIMIMRAIIVAKITIVNNNMIIAALITMIITI